MRERDNNFYMDYEDNGFGGSPMQQNEALANIVSPPAPEKKAPANDATIESLIKQIQARSNTSQWSGGYGADEATKDMARILAETGITNISQFGPITQEVEKIVGYEEWGAPIYGTVTEQTFGNKETGQAVPNTYTERQTGNFFGGTYEGKGNTGYGVQFDDQGLPVFYTQGASSSDMDSLAPFLTLAAMVPGLQPFAMAANAAIAAKQGNPLGVITNLAGMGNLAGVSGMADVAKAAKFASAVQSGDPLAMAFSGANLGGVTNIGGIDLKDISKTIGGIKAIQSGDPLTMMLYGIDAMPKSGGTTSTSSVQKDFFDSEQERLTAAGYSKDDIKNYFRNLENLTEDLDFQPEAPPVDSIPPMPTRSLTGGPEREEADDFLKSIGIQTLDKSSDSGLSNQDILNMINADNGMLITGKRDTVGRGVSEDILRNLEDAGEIPLPTPENKLEKLEIVGNRPKEEMTVQQEPANLDEFLKSLEPYKAPAEKLEELVMTTNRDTLGRGMSDDIARNLEDAGGNELIITGNREPKYLPTDDDFMPTPIKDEGVMEIVTNRDKTQEHVFDPTFGGTLPLPAEPVASTPSVGAPKGPTPKAPSKTAPVPTASAPSMPFIYQEPVNQNIIPELAKVFYFGKNFGGQQQKLSPEGELLTTPYNQLSVTQAGAEPMPQPIPVAQDAKGGENDVSALLQQIMASGDPNMTQEELMQLIQSRG